MKPPIIIHVLDEETLESTLEWMRLSSALAARPTRRTISQELHGLFHRWFGKG